MCTFDFFLCVFGFIIYVFREEKDDSSKSTTTPATSTIETKETPEIDEDGYNVRPKTSENWTNDKNSFYSSSDSDSGNVV